MKFSRDAAIQTVRPDRKYNAPSDGRRKESLAMKRKYKVGGGCVLCLMCVLECPVKAISIRENVSAYIDPARCIGCGRCADNCQAEIIVPDTDSEEN